MGLIKDIILEEIEFLKEKLKLVVKKEGINSKRVLELSQYIDIHLVELYKIENL